MTQFHDWFAFNSDCALSFYFHNWICLLSLPHTMKYVGWDFYVKWIMFMTTHKSTRHGQFELLLMSHHSMSMFLIVNGLLWHDTHGIDISSPCSLSFAQNWGEAMKKQRPYGWQWEWYDLIEAKKKWNWNWKKSTTFASFHFTSFNSTTTTLHVTFSFSSILYRTLHNPTTAISKVKDKNTKITFNTRCLRVVSTTEIVCCIRLFDWLFFRMASCLLVRHACNCTTQQMQFANHRNSHGVCCCAKCTAKWNEMFVECNSLCFHIEPLFVGWYQATLTAVVTTKAKTNLISTSTMLKDNGSLNGGKHE